MVNYTGGNPHDRWSDPNAYRRYEENKTKNWTPGFGGGEPFKLGSGLIATGTTKPASPGQEVNPIPIGDSGGEFIVFLLGAGLIYGAYYIHEFNWITAAMVIGGGWMVSQSILEIIKLVLTLTTVLAFISFIYIVMVRANNQNLPQTQQSIEDSVLTNSLIATVNTENLTLRRCAKASDQECPAVAIMPQRLKVKVFKRFDNGWVELETANSVGTKYHGFANGNHLSF